MIGVDKIEDIRRRARRGEPIAAPRGDGTGECTLVRMGAVRCLVWRNLS